MELHMHSHHFARRMPDWRAAAIAGCIAGVVFLLLELFVTWIFEQSPWGAPRMIAAIALGRGVLSQPAAFGFGIILVALIVQFVLSVILALVLAVIIAPFRLDSSVGMASLAGAAFGVALYLVNFYGIGRIFPWFAECFAQVAVSRKPVEVSMPTGRTGSRSRRCGFILTSVSLPGKCPT
jgi:hypothetical protein